VGKVGGVLDHLFSTATEPRAIGVHMNNEDKAGKLFQDAANSLGTTIVAKYSKETSWKSKFVDFNRLFRDLGFTRKNNAKMKVGSLDAEVDYLRGKYWIKGGFRELDRQGREERELRYASISRLQMAMFGGVALITPMLIMALHPQLNVALITTSIATVIFGVLIAFGAKDSTGKDVLGATAAYAAVLVVFVGTSLARRPETLVE
jgi:hypothetical protein